jgi:hypothetical protein
MGLLQAVLAANEIVMVSCMGSDDKNQPVIRNGVVMTRGSFRVGWAL